MLTLHRLNGDEVIVNASHILTLERTPDTVVTLTSGEKMLVREPIGEIIEKNTEYLRQLGRGPILVPVSRQTAAELDP